jgi:hypothetical protein
MLPLSSQLLDRIIYQLFLRVDIASIFLPLQQSMDTRLAIPFGGFGDRNNNEKALVKLKNQAQKSSSNTATKDLSRVFVFFVCPFHTAKVQLKQMQLWLQGIESLKLP